MQVFLLRHGIAVSQRTLSYPGDDRPLTAAGIKSMTTSSRGMVKCIPSLDAIMTSPLKRAAKSAAIVADAFGAKSLLKTSVLLLPGGDRQRLRDELSTLGDESRVLLVGHNPDLELFASELLGIAAPAVQFKKGALCRIDLAGAPPRMTGRLVWHLTSKHLCFISDAS